MSNKPYGLDVEFGQLQVWFQGERERLKPLFLSNRNGLDGNNYISRALHDEYDRRLSALKQKYQVP